MGRTAQSYRGQATGDVVPDPRSPVQDQGQRSRPVLLRQDVGVVRYSCRPLRQRRCRGEVHDDRVTGGPPLDLVDAPDGGRVRGVRAQPVHGLGGEGHQLAVAQCLNRPRYVGGDDPFGPGHVPSVPPAGGGQPLLGPCDWASATQPTLCDHHRSRSATESSTASGVTPDSSRSARLNFPVRTRTPVIPGRVLQCPYEGAGVQSQPVARAPEPGHAQCHQIRPRLPHEQLEGPVQKREGPRAARSDSASRCTSQSPAASAGVRRSSSPTAIPSRSSRSTMAERGLDVVFVTNMWGISALLTQAIASQEPGTALSPT